MAARSSTTRVVLVGGWERNGTTLVRNLLAAHPDVVDVATDWTVPTRRDALVAATGIDQPRDDTELRRCAAAAVALGPLAKWELTEADVVPLLVGEPSWDAVFAAMVGAVGRREPGRVVVVKSPGLEQSFLRLRSAFAERFDARFVYAVRAPEEGYASWARRGDAWGKGALASDPLVWSTDWLSSTSAALELAYADPASLLVVRYEDVVADPGGVARRLCAHAGLADEAEAMLTLGGREANTSFAGAAQAAGGTGVVVAPSRAAATTGAAVDAVRTACGRRAAAFGYPGPLEPPAAAATEAMAVARVPTRRLVSLAVRRVLGRRRSG